MNRCSLEEGQTGIRRTRENTSGAMTPVNYGKITLMTLDFIEKKPPGRFLPGFAILLAGSFGYNLQCPFCQNHKISMAGGGDSESVTVGPEELVQKAAELGKNGNIGATYTYSGPLVGWEYVRDTGHLAKEIEMKNVIVTNGSVSDQVLDEILPVADAMNIDLKGFTENCYRKLGGDLETVKHLITCVNHRCHVELTVLIVSGGSDSDGEMKKVAGWISPLGPEILLHVIRFLPHWKMDDRPATDATRVYVLVQTAREYLGYVRVGNC